LQYQRIPGNIDIETRQALIIFLLHFKKTSLF
jgi:hypothetical protein